MARLIYFPGRVLINVENITIAKWLMYVPEGRKQELCISVGNTCIDFYDDEADAAWAILEKYAEKSE